MAKISYKKISYIKKLYYRDLFSMKKIAENLDVSIDAVVYFMRKYDLKRRKPSENEKIKFAKKPLSFKIKTNLSQKEKELKTIAVALYWGEGYKSKKATNVDFANSDTEMIKIFLKFLRKICNIDESKLRIYLYCYDNQNPKYLIKYWSKITRVPIYRFTKPYVRKDFRLEKKGKMKYGLIHVRYYDKKLLLLILDWIDQYRQTCVGTQAVNEVGL
ncbi:MAG: hypothetical protein COV33_02070 [Candidatus Zambryskibacteria bacterium CG10_big_fil_rev_8_21_14_0_10_34_34]|uniref:Homing endonuclease LAGLIDADG domain-containing protein n=1 Tax=Candidatus Zambryskibacteria bacterium CG10_big_fil_rev_8_21_14_0_10_34_34 TaxID=1975114 RepID=A0A2H0R189_9BACT|nr:MAG: hypothetical protein COV33_02070 [Candidatus Zambryskibacteria bacterium CG10_big_fil_rev_8_21_14_0_10_34_34]